MNSNTPGPGVAVLAAGKGTRMRSNRPKVLHEVCGRPMASHVLVAARELHPERITVVYGHGGDAVRAALEAPDISFVEQDRLLGTADAVERCHEALAGARKVLVLNGDAPLLTGATLRKLVELAEDATMAIAVNRVPDHGAFGRVRRDAAGRICEIVEAEGGEGGEAERNAGFYVFDADWLWEQVGRVAAADKGERYLTALAAMAYEQGRRVVAVEVDGEDAMGVDDRVRLAEAERIMRARVLEHLMLGGVTVRDPATTYADATVQIDQDVTIEPGCHLRGATRIGSGTVIGPGAMISNATIGRDCVVRQASIEDSQIGDRVTIGSFAHLRGGTEIGDDCELGNYAEVKNSRLGRAVKMHHFGYIGDADVGDDVNYAAGAVTCNYDGVSKHRTVIGARAFIGCDTMLVAPVTVGAGALTGAGSVITRDVAPGERVAGVPARTLRPRPADSD